MKFWFYGYITDLNLGTKEIKSLKANFSAYSDEKVQMCLKNASLVLSIKLHEERECTVG